jgi:hypothetical protein
VSAAYFLSDSFAAGDLPLQQVRRALVILDHAADIRDVEILAVLDSCPFTDFSSRYLVSCEALSSAQAI